MPDRERVATLLRTTAAQKGIQADTELLLSAYCIAYQTPEENEGRALDWVVCDQVDAIDSHLVAEAMLRECVSWSSVTASSVAH